MPVAFLVAFSGPFPLEVGGPSHIVHVAVPAVFSPVPLLACTVVAAVVARATAAAIPFPARLVLAKVKVSMASFFLVFLWLPVVVASLMAEVMFLVPIIVYDGGMSRLASPAVDDWGL